MKYTKLYLTMYKAFVSTIIPLPLVYFVLMNIISPAYAQLNISTSGSTESVTSDIDALIKSVLIIAQTAIVGITFSHLVFQRVLKREGSLKSGNTKYPTPLYSKKRITIIILSCSIAIISSATGSVFVQAYSLSGELGLDTLSTFSILISTSVGNVWLMRIITSIIIAILIVLFYINGKIKGTIFNRIIKTSTPDKNPYFYIAFITILVLGSINILSNGMISHNNAVSFFPTLAVSADWLHFMTVSVWIGGLFYISTILLQSIKTTNKGFDRRNISTNPSTNPMSAYVNTYYLALLLPYFSLIAIASLGIIGVTGLYMAWLHLHNPEAIFNTHYGNMLSIKLLVAFPMIILGAYHQIRIHKTALKIASIGKIKDSQINLNSELKVNEKNSNNDVFNKFSKTIKMESIIGIAVLVVASFLTITSPPSLANMDHSAMDHSMNMGDDHTMNEPGLNQRYSLNGSAILIIILSALVVITSIINFMKSKKDLKHTLELLK